MAHSASPASRTTLSGPLIVGRTAERVLLQEQLADAVGGHGRLVIIGGEAGIGKTTLARDLARAAAERGALGLVGHCYDLTATPPYGPWLDLASGYRPTASMPPLPPILASTDLEGVTSQAALFAQVLAFLARIAETHPVLVVLEDLHWADPASLELLRHIGAHLAGVRLLLAITYRVDELTRRHPFYQHLPALVRETEGMRLDLKRLGADELRALVTTRYALPESSRDRLVGYLQTHAEGNPFYAVELLRTLEETGGLRRPANGWVLGELDRVVMPPLVRQVIDGRVARLGEETREPLAVAAVIGQEVPLDLWADVAGLAEDAQLAIVEDAVAANLLTAAPDGTRVQFAHALTRETLYDSVLPPRRRLVHRQVADALSARPAPDPDVVAYHFQQAGDPRAPEWLARAGERAQRAYAWLTARERFATAASSLAATPGHETTRAHLLYRCGRLQRYSNAAQGIADVREASRLAEAAGLKVLAADATYSVGLLRCFADDFRLGLDEMIAGIEALEALSPDEAQSSWATVAWLADALPAIELAQMPEVEPAAGAMMTAGMNHRRGGLPWFLAAAGRLGEAAAVGNAFVGVVAGLNAGPLVISATGHAYHGLAMVHAARGDPDRAREAIKRAREIYRRLDHHAVIAFTYLMEMHDIVLPYQATDLAARSRVAAEAEQALKLAGGALPSDISPRRAHLGLCYLEGRWAEARQIVTDTATHGNYVLRRTVTVALAPIAYHQGRADEVQTHIRSLLPFGAASEPGGIIFLDGLALQRLAAFLALDADRLDDAHAWLEANDRWLAWAGSILGRAENRTAWALHLRAAGDVARACALADEAIRGATKPCQPLALLAAHRLRGELATAMRDRPVAEQELAAALALADACAAPFERALSLIALAELRLATGKVGAATAHLAEARAICAPLEARPALARIDALTDRVATPALSAGPLAGLTPREVEVLHLVAQGLTDAEVAGRLFISHRTVGQHLRSIYGKLDVPSRSAATRYAMEHGLA